VITTTMERAPGEDGWGEIYFMVLRHEGLKGARLAYREAYGVPHTDKSIDEEIEQCYSEAVGGECPHSKVEVPHYLILALILREGFAGRKRGSHKPLGRWIADARAKYRYKLLRKKGLSAEQAAERTSDTRSRTCPRWKRVAARDPSR